MHWLYFINTIALICIIIFIIVHLGGGICGQIVTCLCDKSIGVLYAGTQESFKWLGWSLLGIIAYAAWAGTVTALLMLPLHLSGRLKYTDENSKSMDFLMNRT